jgi:class 3 adenylate cyclase
MAIAGAPVAHAAHAEAIMSAALEVREAVARLAETTGLPLAVRIGVETGPVVAGVIGRAKFAYDVWGRTVNIAARLQPLCYPGDILVGEGTKEALGPKYAFRFFGTPHLQGVGAHPAWLIVSEAEADVRTSA